MRETTDMEREVRDKQTIFLLTPSEHQKIADAAHQERVSMGEYIRRQVIPQAEKDLDES